MRIAQLAPLWMSVPPSTYGGAERVVHILTEELVRRGHDVTLFASGDSRTSAKLVAVCRECVTELIRKEEAWEYELYLSHGIAECLKHANEFDVIHSHLGTSSIAFGACVQTPFLHTVVTAPGIDDCWMVREHPEAAVVALTRHQQQELCPENRPNTWVIANGRIFDVKDFSPTAGQYLAFVGRMSQQKSPLAAIQIARAAGMPLLLAGAPMSNEEEIYFTRQVKPLVDDKHVRYIGPVDERGRVELLQNAAALLFPIQWSEPFGLVMIEAMACGTPVLACNKGSVPEVIEPGVTGYYADGADELAAMVKAALALDRRRIFEHARERFGMEQMTDRYERVYEHLCSRRACATQ